MATDEQRAAFGGALQDVLDRLGMSQTALAAEVGRALGRGPVSQPWISEIRRGAKEPSVEVAFAIEEVVGVKPGQLTRHLGYVPAGARASASVVDAIEGDVRLDDRGRRSLLAAYGALVER